MNSKDKELTDMTIRLLPRATKQMEKFAQQDNNPQSWQDLKESSDRADARKKLRNDVITRSSQIDKKIIQMVKSKKVDISLVNYYFNLPWLSQHILGKLQKIRMSYGADEKKMKEKEKHEQFKKRMAKAKAKAIADKKGAKVSKVGRFEKRVKFQDLRKRVLTKNDVMDRRQAFLAQGSPPNIKERRRAFLAQGSPPDIKKMRRAFYTDVPGGIKAIAPPIDRRNQAPQKRKTKAQLYAIAKQLKNQYKLKISISTYSRQSLEEFIRATMGQDIIL